MLDYPDFLRCFAEYAASQSIRWAVAGSWALVAHAERAGITFYRDAGDLDLVACLPRTMDAEFRGWLGRENLWVYQIHGLAAVHFRCDNRKQVDIFTLPPDGLGEIDRATEGVVMGLTVRVAPVSDLLRKVREWAEGAKDDHHPCHKKQGQYETDAAWIEAHLADETNGERVAVAGLNGAQG